MSKIYPTRLKEPKVQVQSKNKCSSETTRERKSLHRDRVVFFPSPTLIAVQFQISSQMGFRATRWNERQSPRKVRRGNFELASLPWKLTLWVMGKVTPTPLSIFSKENKMYGRLALYGKSNGVAESQAKGGMNLLTSIQFKILNNPKINPVPPRHNFRRRRGAAAGCSRPQETTLKPKLK